MNQLDALKAEYDAKIRWAKFTQFFHDLGAMVSLNEKVTALQAEMVSLNEKVTALQAEMAIIHKRYIKRGRPMGWRKPAERAA